MTRMIPMALAVTVVFMCGLPARAQLVNVRVTTDSSVDTSSAEAVVKQITRPEMSDEEKAVACWRFMLDHYYHWYPPREENVPTDVRDFAKAVNSYGFGPCFLNAPVLTALWEACGLETRSWTITGHSIPEVKYGGAWHMLDADARGWHRKADGQIASVDELAGDAKLITDPKEKSVPFYPFALPDAVAKPLEPWGPPSKMMDLYLSRKDNYVYNRRAVMGHPMMLTLRPGEKLAVNREGAGKWYKFGGMPDHAVVSGPVDVSKSFTYGNGRLTWKPNLTAVSDADLLWMGSSNVKLTDGLLQQQKGDVPGVAVFRVWCPYVLVESAVSVVERGGNGASRFEVSVDGGVAWSAVTNVSWQSDKAGIHFGAMDLSRAVAGRYELLVRVTLEKAAKLDELSFDSLFQVSQLALPRLKPGKNRVTVFRGADENVVQRVLGNSREAKERYVVEHKGLGDPLKRLTPEKYGEPASVTYALSTPGALTALSIGAHMTMDAGKDQHIAASYSLDEGKTWTEVWRISDNSNGQNSQFEMDKRVTLDPSADARVARMKFDMVRNSKYFSIGGIRLYAFYRQPQPAGVKMLLDFSWQEKTGGAWGAAKAQSVAVTSFPFEFDVTCEGEEARVVSLGMQTAGAR